MTQLAGSRIIVARESDGAGIRLVRGHSVGLRTSEATFRATRSLVNKRPAVVMTLQDES